MKKNNKTSLFCPCCGQKTKRIEQPDQNSVQKIKDVIDELSIHEQQFLVNFINRNGFVQEPIDRVELLEFGRPWFVYQLNDHTFGELGETLKSMIVIKLQKS